MEKKELERLLRDGWVKDKDYVFVSYASHDWEKVYPCVLELRARGINVFIDAEFQENSSSSWLSNLEERMIRSFKCKGVISFVSTSYLGSYACLTELVANRSNRQVRRKGSPLPVFYVALEHELETPQQIVNYVRQETIRTELNQQTVRIEPEEYAKMGNFLLGCRLHDYPDRQAVQELLDDIHTRFDVATLMNELIFSSAKIMPSIQPLVNATECAELLTRNFVNDKNESINLPVLADLRRETRKKLGRTGPIENQRPTPAETEKADNPKELEQIPIESLSFRAAQGDAAAQYNLGERYENGWGVKKDEAQAVYWYHKAAEQGYANAQFCLASKYQYGRGVKQDWTQVVYWYRKLVEQGVIVAQFLLGQCYELGNGVEKDEAQAVYWYRRAAEQGYATAQKKLDKLGM